MIGVASLSLAACGGGETTVQTQQPKTEPVPPTRDCTAVPLPAGCPDPEPTPPAVPLPLDGLGDGPKTAAAIALREVADTSKVQLTYGTDDDAEPWESRLAIQGLQLRLSKTQISLDTPYDRLDTKIVDVTPSGSGDNIAYSFGLYLPEARTDFAAFSAGFEQGLTHPFEHKIFSLEDNDDYTSVKRIESIASRLGEGWDYSILKSSVPSVKGGAKDSTLYAELWTDYASAGKSDYMVGGWWLLAPNNPAGDYRFGAIAKGENYYIASSSAEGAVKLDVTGTATYKGNAAGLHLSSENGIQRLLGKVTLTADFGNASARGTIKGEINNLILGGESVGGQILFPSAPFHNVSWYVRPTYAMRNNPINFNLNPKSKVGNIKGINYQGDWAGTFLGDSSGTAQPTGIVGVVGGSGGGNSFVASFGAKKVGAE